ncbi:MAG: HAD family hydrolase [Defluviitaleaceae bacterium]|nr:HAD family hydrolase [Defluviitaleaceae bacterium]
MGIKAIGFDIGQTLVNYNAPLSWKSLFPDALSQVARVCGIDKNINLKSAIAILSKYNTRENPREYEVSSDVIFKEILGVWNVSYEKLDCAKEAFYRFFQSNAVLFDDAEPTLAKLSAKGILLGFLTDVAYGMDNKYSLEDISQIRSRFDGGFTSVDVGFRKPSSHGFEMLLEAFGLSPSEMMYVGDEEKDIIGANNVGMVSVLISRNGGEKSWGQNYTIKGLDEILGLL